MKCNDASVTRRRFLGAIGVSCLTTDCLCRGLLADGPTKSVECASGGRRFLEDLFDSSLNLLPEYPGAHVYWLFHDNYLASKLLAKTNPRLADKIKTAIRHFGVDHSGKIEILFGEAKQPLPFRQYELNDVRSIGDKLIKTEVVTETVFKGWEAYADLLFLAAIAESDGAKARQHLDDGFKFWDGMGFKDRAAEKQFATYKLAFSLIAAAKLGRKVASQPAILERLLSLQGRDGGWITDFNRKGEPVGSANVETTCLAILALEAEAQAG